MNYNISSVNELVTQTNYILLNIENNIIKQDFEKIIKILDDEKLNPIIIEINSTIDIHYFEVIINRFKDNITEIKFHISKISEKDIREYALVLSNKFLFMKVDEINQYLVFETKFENSIEVAVTNNLNLINNINISKLTLQPDEKKHFFYLVETLNRRVSELQNKIKEQDQKMKALEKSFNAGAFDSQNIRYNNLMEKYKDTLKRLENLRNSRLGKLQIKYWDLKG